jgi:phage RecT family recombinase
MAEPSRNTQNRPPAANGDPKAKPRERTRVDDVRALVTTRMRGPVETLLAKRQEFDRFARVFLNVVEGNADLVKCTDGSLARAFMHSAELNLQVGSAYPHAYLIPYWNPKGGADGKGGHEAQFQISVWGYTELFRRSGQVRKIWADVVCEHDEFDCISGTDGKLVKHRPNWFATREARGRVIGSYACALLENGETVCEPVSREELDAARAANRGKTPAWDIWFEQQCMKVAIKRLGKYLAKGEDTDRALDVDADPGTAIDVPGYEVPNDSAVAGAGGAANTTNAPLDQVVARERAAEAAGSNGERELRIDRVKLLGQLADVDERWKEERARVEGWDELQALAAAAFCNALMRDINGTGEPPDLPPHMRIWQAEDVSGGVIS